MNEEAENWGYYQPQGMDPGGMRYRLEGDDVIQSAVHSLRGGIRKNEQTGTVEYNEAYRLLNEEGIARVELFIRGGVNKINHLTKYKNEDRIMRQMRSLMRAFLIELVENIKWWAPGARREGGKLVNPEIAKVRNKHMVLQVVENALFQSMQRGQEGFEAELTGKHFVVTEQVGRQPEEQQSRFAGLSGLFGMRRRGGGDYG